MDSREESTEKPQGMLRKNITITRQENSFLERHPEINQSALFRQVVESMMLAEKGTKYASVRDLKLGRAVYRSGAVMYRPRSDAKDRKKVE